MKQTMYLVVWHAIQIKDSEWANLYERLVPIKCSYDEKRRTYIGKGRVIGRIAGQMLSVIYTLLKKDQETTSKLLAGAKLPEPTLYDPQVHRQHRSGQYQSPRSGNKPRKLIQLPSH